MMPYEVWLARIIDAARNISSRAFQKEAWFPGGKVKSCPNEIYQVLMEDCTFDLFFETYGRGFTEHQIRSSKALKSALQQYYDMMPRHPDPIQVLDDPKWSRVRHAADRFVRDFGGEIALKDGQINPK